MKSDSILILGFIGLMAACSGKDPAQKTAGSAIKASYQLAKIGIGGVGETLKVPAQLAAFQEVSIFPKVNGYVKMVGVDIGSKVRPGQLLMELEAPELEQASLQARERYARAKSEYTIDRENYERLKEASLTAGAVSPQDLASLEAKMSADSSLSNAEKANWQEQETMRSYLKVRAPFEGVITLRTVHPGALVSAEARDSKPMLELKQVSHLRLQVDIPEGIASNMKEGDSVFFYLSAFPGKKMIGRVSRKSQDINLEYRSERMEMDVYNKSGLLAPGMYADVVLEARGTPLSLTVPKSAVVTSTERKYVLVVRNGKATKVDVSTGHESAGTVEIFGALRAGEEVIANADDEISEGQAVH